MADLIRQRGHPGESGDEPGDPWHRRFDRTDWTHLGGMAAFILVLSAIGWIGLISQATAGHSIGTRMTFGVGLGLTAYVLGVRHAFDADHIAAIDNTTRKFVGEGKRARSLGFWFSLGHSSVVFLLCALLAAGMRTLVGELGNGSSPVKQVLGLVGTLIAGTFLILIGLLNLRSLVGIGKVFSLMRTQGLDEQELERHLAARGVMARLLGRALAAVSRPWHMYMMGFLFGLGFDTASEVTLLVLAGGAESYGLPWQAVIVIPVLFAAGMTLFDTADGVFMSSAYEWAFRNPVRKVFYNLTVTALSVLVALVIGTIELLQLAGSQFGVRSGLLEFVGRIDLEYVGYGVVSLFLLTWAVAWSVWRFARIDKRWADPVADNPP
jgi:nickel/cobalt transporter (NiCoT) family protein